MKPSSKEFLTLQLQENIDYYHDQSSGLVVFTEAYHLKKGTCCGSGCRHCPYAFEGVPEPQRSKLLLNLKNTSK